MRDKFEENYFAGYYKGMVGEFEQTDLARAERWFWGWFQAVNKDINLKKGEGRRVLEIGCSIGGAALILKKRGFEVYASDISKYALDKAAKLQPDVKFLRWDVHKKFPLDVKFDLVYGFEVIEHLENPQLALKNIKVILKPKGKVLFSSPFPYKYVYRDPTHINVKKSEEWRKIFTSLGYRKLKLKRVSFLPLLYRLSKRFHIILPFSINSRFVNSTLFIIGSK